MYLLLKRNEMKCDKTKDDQKTSFKDIILLSAELQKVWEKMIAEFEGKLRKILKLSQNVCRLKIRKPSEKRKILLENRNKIWDSLWLR